MLPRRPSLRLVPIALCAALTVASGCASSRSLSLARGAETRQDYDAAVAEYTRLLKQSPGNADARLGLERSRLRASQDHLSRARRLVASGSFDERA